MTEPHVPAEAADIAWMRNLAAEGAAEPLRGGATLLAAGLLFGGASLFQWAVLSQALPIAPSSLAIVWPVITVAFVAFATIYGIRTGRSAGVRTAANRASATVWTSVGLGIFTLFVSMGLMGWRMGVEVSAVALGLIPSVIMVFYGLGWAVSGSMFRSTFLWRLSVASFVAAPVLAAFTGSTWQYLVYALCLFALMALPGWLLMRKVRAAEGPGSGQG